MISSNNQKVRTYVFVALGIIVILGLIWWGSSRQQATPVTGEPVEIGAIFMLTGISSSWGQHSQQGADLAVEEINAAGGIDGRPLKIAYEDNQGDNAKVAVSAFNKLVNDGTNIILGTNWTPSGLALAPLACEQNVLMISPTLGVADFNEACDSLFNLWPHDEALHELLGEFVYSQGHRKIAILGTLQEWEKRQAEAVRRGFERAGGEVVAFELARTEQADLRSEITKLKSSNPEAVVSTTQSVASVASRQIIELGVDVPFFSVFQDRANVEAAQGAFEDVVMITWFNPTEEFQDAFRAQYGVDPDIGSDTSYDAVILLAEAMRATSSTDTVAIKGYINSLDKYEGASGILEFDGKGGVTKEPTFTIVRDGNFVPYDPAN